MIQLATAEDIPGILEIENLSFPIPFTREMFLTELVLQTAHLYVARQENGRIVGYIDFWHVSPEIHLISIAVHPEARRQKVGASLMDFLLNFSRRHKAKEIYLDVRASNQGAISLYERYQFEKVGLRKGYYADNKEDAVLMLRKL